MMVGWEHKPLGDLCEVLDSQRRPVTKKDRRLGDYPYYGATGIVDYVDEFIFDEPLVLVGEDGAKWGSGDGTAFSVSGRCWVNNHAHVLRPDRTKLIDAWLVHYLVHEDLSRFVSGLTVPKLNQGNLREIPIPVPPLAEQRRIVAILDEAFEAIATAKANTEKSLTGIDDCVDAAQRVCLKNGGADWSNTTLGQIGKVSMCKRVFKEETSPTGDIPFYKIGTFGREPDAFISREMYEQYRSRFSFPAEGSVLISAAGTIGRRVRYDGQPAYFQDSNIVWVENDESLVLNEYLYHFYGCCDWNSTTGATISRLYNDDLRRITVSFPKAIAEQRRIVGRLDRLLEQKRGFVSLYERKLSAFDELKKSLLHQAFTGQLTAKVTDQQLEAVI